MWVTLYTDGGYIYELGIAAYGFYIRAEGFKHVQAGILKATRPNVDATKAEVAGDHKRHSLYH